ncbi:MAG: ATP-binding protein [Treponema sp.]|nr:ATP-binding protein [Treponema sp.]
MLFLEEQRAEKNASFVVLYGRRRVGKTALISRFIRKKRALYFLATEEGEGENREAFRNLAAEFSGNELLRHSDADWLLIWKTLVSEAGEERLIIAIDEFQYLAQANPAFPSVMQKIWDTVLADKNIMLILCGSSVSMMESACLSYGSPLYGRRTGQIKLAPIPFSHYGKFFPKTGERELAELYAVTGGIPKYIEFFRHDSGGLFEKIRRHILSASGFLYDEPAFLLQKEVSEIGSYFSIIKTIAAGNHKLAQIAAAMNIKQTGLSKYLGTLISLDIIEREVPVTEEKPEKSKRGRYRIRDNFLLFWFKFVFPSLSYAAIGKTAVVEKKIKENFIDGHAGFVYEDICRERMRELDFSKNWGFTIDRCGRWWDHREEIDIAAYDSGGEDIIFGECKFTAKKTGPAALRELERKSRLVDWKAGRRRDHFILFSVSGYTGELKALAKTRKDLLLK